MASPYEKMYVLGEKEYRDFKRYKASRSVSPPPPPHTIQNPVHHPSPETVKCPICGRDFLNRNILAHHLKSHVDGFKCNICGKVLKNPRSLNKHLKAHAPQVHPSNVSVLDKLQHSTVVKPQPAVQLGIKHFGKHKRKKRVAPLKFQAKQWLTL